MADPCCKDLRLHLAVAAAFDSGDREHMHDAAIALAEAEGAECVHEVLRFLHLFYGFPRLVRAWNALPADLRAGEVNRPSSEPLRSSDTNGDTTDDTKDGFDQAAQKDLAAAGESAFRDLYHDRADRVLSHLRMLDPLSTDWVLQHAYARVMSRPHLTTPVQERIAAMALANTHCWQQWRSHVDIALRLGVSTTTLREDLDAVDWLDSTTRSRAEELLQ
jgi:hypothetical protein